MDRKHWITYDAAGNRTYLRRRDGTAIGYAYDNLNPMIVKNVPASSGGAAGYSVYYGYDLGNRQLYARFGSATGAGITNAYDAFGNLGSTISNMDGVSRTLSYSYDLGERRSRITHPDGNAFDQSWDPRGRPIFLSSPVAGGILFDNYTAQGPLGNASRVNDATYYTYDSAQRLIAAMNDHAGTASDVIWYYGYNPAGQMTSLTRTNDAYAWTGAYNVSRSYTVNGLNQYTAAGGVGFSYDANGNLTGDGSNAYMYDAENRLVSASGAHPASLSYDPLGRLWQVTNNSTGAVTRFLYDGDALVLEYDGSGNLLRRHVHSAGADVPAITYEGAGLTDPRWLFANHQGSIVAASNATGAMSWLNSYDEWGIPGAGNAGRFQYTGQAWLSELGMYYYKARIYSPTLGRFLQTDPVGYADQNNLYEYVGDDPVNHTDPSGMTIVCNQTQCIITPSHFDSNRSNGQTTTLNAAQGQQAVADRGNFRTNGQDETVGFGFGTRSGDTRTEVSRDARTTRGASQYDSRTRQRGMTADVGRARIPAGATWAQHAHIEGSDQGMADNTGVGGGYGDSEPLTHGLANVVISDNRVGVREIVNGELQHRMLFGRPSLAEQRSIERNLETEQPLFYLPRP